MSKKRQSDVNSSASSSKRRHLSEVNKDDGVIENNLSLTQKNEAIRSGKIAKIHLINFMCHSNLSMEFHNRVNLLIGCNGSGKSAILTALVIGLGARAKDTNRSSSIKQLIKNGENSADIEITIANNGSDSYEYDVYGNFITICRHITQSGASQYKIKDERGHIVSKKIDDLHKILLYHNIQTDNPVFVLNQDSARTFLKEMEPSKNYQLFLKATQIETIVQKLNDCGLMYNKYRYQIEVLRKESEAMERDLKELNDKHERLQSADEIRMNIERYKLEQLWLKVQNQENILDKLKNEIRDLNVECEKYQQSIDNKSSTEKEYQIQINTLLTELRQKNNSIHAENEKLNNLKIAYASECEKYENKNNEINKLANKIANFKEQINTIDSRIAARSGSEMSRIQKMRQENEEKLSKLMQQQQEIKAIIDQQKHDLEMVNETKGKYEDQFELLKRQREKYMNNIVTLQHKVSDLNSSSKNLISLYGSQMPQFLEEIQKAHKKGAFSALPRGPLGQYIQVPNQKLRGPIEYLLQSLLKVFIVNNSNDRKILDKIKSNFNGFKPTVITTKFCNQIYDVTQGMVYPPEDTLLLMNEIKCKDPVVMNCLIDFIKVETILLCENQNLAVQLTSLEENVPSNLKRLILLKPFLEYYPAPMYRTYSNNPRKPQFIQVNVADLKNNIDNEIAQNQTQKTECETKLRDLKSKLQEIYRQIKLNETIMEKHQNSKGVYAEKIQEINSIEYPEESQIDFYKKEKLELEMKIEEITDDLQQKEKTIKGLLQQKIDCGKLYQNQKEFINNNDKEINLLRRNVDEIKFKLSSLLSEARNWKRKKDEITEAVQEKTTKLDNENINLNKEIEKASQHGKRIPVTNTIDNLIALIKKNQYHLKQISSTQESIEDIKALLEDKKFKYEKNEKFIVTLSQSLELLRKSRVQRFKFIINLKQHMALRVKYTFDSVLKVKNFVGGITIDHKEQQLYMKVIPRDNHIDNAVSNTKSLSGGERSYSTIALLLSLWSCVDHPFYFLDEYDVFTDEVNREIMTKLLLSESEKKPHRQYTFLTPQDISFVQATDIISIHRLAEPRR